MTVDIRATIVTDLGATIGGQLSEDHIDTNNVLAKVRGTLTFNGVKNLARGTAVNIAYIAPGFNQITRFPRRLWILSSKVSPFEEITTVEVGCALTLKADLKPPNSISVDTVIPDWQAVLPQEMRFQIPSAFYAKDILSYCLSQIGIEQASGNYQLRNARLTEAVDLSSGYLNTINDLLAAECCYAFMDPAGKLVIRKILASGASGMVLTRDDMITMDYIESGETVADQIVVTWDRTVVVPPERRFKDVDVTEEEEEEEDDDDDVRPKNWQRETTLAASQTYKIRYISEVFLDGIERTESIVFRPSSETITIYRDLVYFDRDGLLQSENVVVERTSTTRTALGAANPTRWKSKRENAEPARASDMIAATSKTTYQYATTQDGLRLRSETTTEYESRVAFAGGLGIQNWKFLDFSYDPVVVSRTTTTNEWFIVSNITKTTVSRWLAWGKTTEGAQGAASQIKKIEDEAASDGERTSSVGAVVSSAQALVFDGAEVRISEGRGASSVQRLPSKQALTKAKIGKDPYRPVDDGEEASYSTEQRGITLNYSTDGTPTATATYDLPFPADDIIEGQAIDSTTLRPVVVSGGVIEQARRYGELMNYLSYGHANGVAITTEIRNIPTEPLGIIFIDVAGVSGIYRANGTSWAWGPEGMIVGTDALLHGAAGTYGDSEFAESWVPIPTTIAGMPVLGPATVNANPKPANTIALPGGFNPNAPGSIWASLPTNGIDVPKASRTVSAVLQPRNENVRIRARSRSRAVINGYDYLLDLGTTAITVVSKAKVRMSPVVPVYPPTAGFELSADAPEVRGNEVVVPDSPYLRVMAMTADPPVVVSVAGDPDIPTAGLVVHLDPGDIDSYPGSGVFITDLTGGNDGILAAGATYSADNGGTIAMGEGKIVIQDSSAHLQNVTSFSVCLFVDFPAGTDENGLFSYGGGDDYSNEIFLLATSGSLSVEVNNGSDGAWTYARPSAGWCMVTLVYDGTQPAADRVKVYIDTTLLSPTSSSYTMPTATANLLGDAWIGSYATYNGQYFLNSSVGPFLLYNRAISSTDISTVFDAYRSRYSL